MHLLGLSCGKVYSRVYLLSHPLEHRYLECLSCRWKEACYELFSHYYCITIADFRLVLAEGMASSAPPIMIKLNDDKVLTLFRYMSKLYRPARKPSKAKQIPFIKKSVV
jgi:hypothetical protein